MGGSQGQEFELWGTIGWGGLERVGRGVKDDLEVVFPGAFLGRNFASPGRSFLGVEG